LAFALSSKHFWAEAEAAAIVAAAAIATAAEAARHCPPPPTAQNTINVNNKKGNKTKK
jgi:hypothetical protein